MPFLSYICQNLAELMPCRPKFFHRPYVTWNPKCTVYNETYETRKITANYLSIKHKYGLINKY